MQDYECDACYPAVIEELNRLTAPELRIDVRTWTGLQEDGSAPITVEVTIDGADSEWTFEGNNDWLSPEIFDKVGQAFAERSDRRLYIVDEGEELSSDVFDALGQCALVMCCPPDVALAIEQLTQAPFVAIE
jgi:hypothetical protein